MNRAKGVFAILAENEANEPTLNVVGDGPLKEGPVDGTDGIEEEGVVGMMVPGVGSVQMIWLDIEGSSHTAMLRDAYRNRAIDAARKLGKRFELVRFGDNGREHVEWIK